MTEIQQEQDDEEKDILDRLYEDMGGKVHDINYELNINSDQV